MKAKRQRCFNCGDDIGVFEAFAADVLTCGSVECEREARNEEAARRDNAMLDAAEDDYGRYR